MNHHATTTELQQRKHHFPSPLYPVTHSKGRRDSEPRAQTSRPGDDSWTSLTASLLAVSIILGKSWVLQRLCCLRIARNRLTQSTRTTSGPRWKCRSYYGKPSLSNDILRKPQSISSCYSARLWAPVMSRLVVTRAFMTSACSRANHPGSWTC